ncbi:hypothetical protein HK105_200083 [Polyrhizophydium stewartii]|uniref:Transmembrane protein n=1 Tax=Polyrhizophydium stewartii TaxID=2732419 RepID=A0ABR4NKG2_9FUNG
MLYPTCMRITCVAIIPCFVTNFVWCFVSPQSAGWWIAYTVCDYIAIMHFVVGQIEFSKTVFDLMAISLTKTHLRSAQYVAVFVSLPYLMGGLFTVIAPDAVRALLEFSVYTPGLFATLDICLQCLMLYVMMRKLPYIQQRFKIRYAALVGSNFSILIIGYLMLAFGEPLDKGWELISTILSYLFIEMSLLSIETLREMVATRPPASQNQMATTETTASSTCANEALAPASLPAACSAPQAQQIAPVSPTQSDKDQMDAQAHMATRIYKSNALSVNALGQLRGSVDEASPH